MALEDYEIICPLNYYLNAAINSYKARKKLSEETCILHAIDYAKFNTNEKNRLVKLITERQVIEHPNVLKFIEFFEDEPFKILYIVSEYCNNGNLSSIIDNCLKERRYLSEELICRLIYQVLLAMKTASTCISRIGIQDIFLDQSFNVKLLNFEPSIQKNKAKDIKMYCMGRIMYCLCSLTKQFDKTNHGSELKKLSLYYSADLISLLNLMLTDQSSLKKHIDKILCNSTILLKSSQWKIEKSFFVIENLIANHQEQNNLVHPEMYLQKLKVLREKEIALQAKEERLKHKEHALSVREKKVALMERMVKEKMTQAELYLRRSRESNKNNTNILSINDHDTSLSADCGDSTIIETSRKLDAAMITKPLAFTRTKSERKVNFKGHSPLKNINYRRRSMMIPKTKTATIQKNRLSLLANNVQIDQPEKNDLYESSLAILSEKSSSSSSSCSVSTCKNLFGDGDAKKVLREINGNQKDCHPISWNEESKKHAFELLRIMNCAIDETKEMKHTYL